MTRAGCWALIKPWLDPRVVEKIQFIKTADLEKYIARENLPEGVGGLTDCSFEFTYNEATESEKKVFEDAKRRASEPGFSDAYVSAAVEFLNRTLSWASSSADAKLRDEAAIQMMLEYKRIMPFIR